MEKRRPSIEVFKARNGEFCWRCIAVNKKELFRASETYKSKKTMINILYKYLGHAGILTNPSTPYDNWNFVDMTIKKK